MCHRHQQTVDETRLPRSQSVGADMLLAIDEGVGDGRGEESGDGRRYDLDPVADEPAHNILVAERVVLDVNLPNESDHGHLLVHIADDAEHIRSFAYHVVHGAVITTCQQRLNGFQVVIVHHPRRAVFLLTRSGRVIELGKRIGKESGFNQRPYDLTPRNDEARLSVVRTRTECHGHYRHLRKAVLDKRVLDKRIVIAGTALSTCLSDGYCRTAEVVLARSERTHQTADDDGGRVTDVVVRHPQPFFRVCLRSHRQRFDTVTRHAEDGMKKLVVAFREIRREDGPLLVFCLKRLGCPRRIVLVNRRI